MRYYLAWSRVLIKEHAILITCILGPIAILAMLYFTAN